MLQGLGPPERADLSLRRWALPDLPAPAAMAAEGRGRQVMYQADFWIAWGLLLSESPNEFADHKENAVCLITELQSVPSPRPPPPPVIFLTRDLSFLFHLMFQSPIPPSLPLLFPFPELLLLLLSLLPLPAGVRRSHVLCSEVPLTARHR